MASVTWEGMDELEAVLEALPEDLGDAGAMIARESAEQAAIAIRAAYPYRDDVLHKTYAAKGWPAHLRDGVIVRENKLPLGTRVWVLNTAPYAYAFESGRRRGKHGTTPARPTFIRLREQYLRDMNELLKALLESRGLKVSGDAQA
jgi:hypothetical protein